MASSAKRQKRTRGTIDVLPSGSLRVRVYAGTDPVSGERHNLVEVIPPGPNAEKEAEKARTKLLNRVDEQRNSRTGATVNQLLDRYFELIRVEATTKEAYESLARVHIRPLIGTFPVGRLDGEILDSFYKQLGKCRANCRGRKYIQHRTDRDHECDDRCGPHECKGLSNGSMRKIHAVLSGAGKRAVRWHWLGVNPFDKADPLPVPRPEPKPPTADQAAAIVTAAFKDVDWGMLVWLAMVTGARRGELCALTWECFTLKPGAGVVTIRSSIAQRGGRTWEKDTKTHQQRRITIDDATVGLLTAYQRRCAERAEFGDEMPGKARIFSSSPDGSTWLKPDSVSQRYSRMCARKPLEWDMHIHQLRHYSATELISAGVDVTTVGGRLGHGGGGSTTLRFYSAWKSEADQRAAGTLATRLPGVPVALDSAGVLRSTAHPTGDARYEHIATDLRGAIMCGALSPGDVLPPLAQIANRYGAAFNTAQRAVKLLESDGLVKVSRGKRAIVAEPSSGGSEAVVVSLQKRRRAT
jgi:integrase